MNEKPQYIVQRQAIDKFLGSLTRFYEKHKGSIARKEYI